jgi:hypothetical protein
MHLHFCQRPPETGAEHRIRPPADRLLGRYRSAYSAQGLSYR